MFDSLDIWQKTKKLTKALRKVITVDRERLPAQRATKTTFLEI